MRVIAWCYVSLLGLRLKWGEEAVRLVVASGGTPIGENSWDGVRIILGNC